MYRRPHKTFSLFRPLQVVLSWFGELKGDIFGPCYVVIEWVEACAYPFNSVTV